MELDELRKRNIEKQSRYRKRHAWKFRFAEDVDQVLKAVELVPDLCSDPDWCSVIFKRIVEIRKSYL